MVVPTRLYLLLLFVISFFFKGSLGELGCEDLPSEVCVLAISSSGRRCYLEEYRNEFGEMEYHCTTSEVVVERMSDYIETNECLKACGIDRKMVGISSDYLLEPQFTTKLCSSACYDMCPNVIDLYFKLAEGEGVYLPQFCDKQRSNPRFAWVELMSSGLAMGPISSSETPLSSFFANAKASSSSSSSFTAEAPIIYSFI